MPSSLPSTSHHSPDTAPRHCGRASRLAPVNAILRRHIIVSIYIYLDDAKLVAHRLLQVFQHRVHHLARLAPCGKEINQYQLIARYYIIECFLSSDFYVIVTVLTTDTYFYSLFVYKTTTSYENYQLFSPFYSFRMNI